MYKVVKDDGGFRLMIQKKFLRWTRWQKLYGGRATKLEDLHELVSEIEEGEKVIVDDTIQDKDEGKDVCFL